MPWCQRDPMDPLTLQTIMARMSSIALIVNQGQVSWVSAPVAFGWPAQILVHGTLSLLWHPEDRQRAIELYEAAKDDWRGQSGLRVVTGDGQVRWVDAQAGPGPGSNCLVILTDVTRCTLTQARIEQAEAETALSAAFAKEILLRTDGNQRLSGASASAMRLLGWDPHELLNTVLADLVHPEDRGALNVQGRNDSTQPSAVRLRSKEGTYRWMSHHRCIATSGEVVESFTDVDTYVDELHRAHEQVAQLEALLRASPLPQVILTPIPGIEDHIVDFAFTWLSEQAIQFLHATSEALVGSPLSRACHGWFDGLRDHLQGAMESGQATVVDQVRLPGSHGADRWIEVHACRIGDLLNLTWYEITSSRQALERLQESERRYRLMADQVLDAVVWLRQGQIQWASRSVERMLGWLPRELIGRRLDEFVHREDLQVFHSTVGGDWASIGDGSDGARWQFRIRSKNLEYHWVQAHARPLTDEDRVADGLAVSLRIVDAEVAVLRELDRQARTDDLTGLLNRRAALVRIASLGSQSRRTGTQVALLLCDVDRFKEINDRYGHAAGDEVLRVIAGRIADCIRTGDLAARFGGDEILVVLDGVHGVSDALDIAEKIRVAASMPMEEVSRRHGVNRLDPLQVTMSIGVVLLEDPHHIQDVMARADLAMYQAKRGGSDRVVSLPMPESGHLIGVA